MASYQSDPPPASTPPGGAASEPREFHRRTSDDTLWRTFFNNANDPILICAATAQGLPGRLVEVNDAAVRLTGYSRDELTQMNLRDLVDPSIDLEQRFQILSGGESLLAESLYRGKDGRRIPVEIHAQLFRLGGQWLAVAVARDISERHRAAEHQRLLAETSRTLGESIDYEATLTNLAQLLVPALADWCVIDLRTPEGELEPVVVMHTDPAKVSLAKETRRRYPAKVSDRAGAPAVIQSGQSELYPDVPDELLQQIARDPAHLQMLRNLGLRSGVVVPLVARGQRLGAMTLIGETPNRYTERDLPFLEEVGRRCGLAVDNAQLYRRAQHELAERRAKEQTMRFLVDLNEATQPLDDPDQIMAVTARRLGEHLGADRCAYAEIEADEDHFTLTGDYTHDIPSIRGRARLTDFGPAMLRLMRTNTPLIAHDVEADPQTRDAPAAYLRRQIRSLVCVPLHKNGRLVAAVAVHQKRPRRWTPEQIELVAVVANRCWEAIERGRALRSLRESEQRFRFLAESVPQKVFTSDSEGAVDYVNEQWLTFAGRSFDEVRGWRWTELIHPDDLDGNVRAWQHSVGTGEPFQLDHRFRRADGVYRWHITRALPMRDSEGRVIMWIGSNTDVHDLKTTQEALRSLNQTLEVRVAERTAVAERRTHQIRRLTTELARAEQRERKRLATILHDNLQQLLAAAKFRLDSLRTRLADDAMVGRAGQVIDLLDQSIEMSRSLTVQLSPPVLHDAGLGAALHWLARWTQQHHGLSVQVQVDPAAEPVSEAIRTFAFEAARELLFNVAKHAGVDRARLEMACGEDDAFTVTIADQGRGFDPTILEDEGSTGMGLMNIHERLAFLGGHLKIESRPEEGTRMTISMPSTYRGSTAPWQWLIGPGDRSEDEAGHLADGAAPARRRTARPIRVLIADDHEILRDGLLSLFEDWPGIKVVGEAADGEAAVEMAMRLEPDVVIMDISMPRLNGIEATRKLHQAMPHIRIIGLSMHEDADMADAIRQAGAENFLTKNGPSQALIDAIQGSSTTQA